MAASVTTDLSNPVAIDISFDMSLIWRAVRFAAPAVSSRIFDVIEYFESISCARRTADFMPR